MLLITLKSKICFNRWNQPYRLYRCCTSASNILPVECNDFSPPPKKNEIKICYACMPGNARIVNVE